MNEFQENMQSDGIPDFYNALVDSKSIAPIALYQVTDLQNPDDDYNAFTWWMENDGAFADFVADTFESTQEYGAQAVSLGNVQYVVQDTTQYYYLHHSLGMILGELQDIEDAISSISGTEFFEQNTNTETVADEQFEQLLILETSNNACLMVIIALLAVIAGLLFASILTRFWKRGA